MGNQLSPGEKAVLALFVAVLAAATGGMVFFGNAILGLQRDIGTCAPNSWSSGLRFREARPRGGEARSRGSPPVEHRNRHPDPP